MCLYTERTRNSKRVVVYKALEKIGSSYFTPFRYTPANLNRQLVSDRKTTTVLWYERGGVISRGIHVLTTKREAKRYASNNCHIFKALVFSEDWVADGAYGEAVYTKIFITDERVY
jgi:hypothetical protein